MKTLIPFEDRVVILQDEAVKETTGGLIIPDASQQKPSRGTIMSVGPGKMKKDGPIGYYVNDKFVSSLDGREKPLTEEDRVVPIYSSPMKEGDKVLYSHYAGHPFEFEGKDYIVMRFDDVIARV